MTNGIVSIVGADGRTLIKIVCGCDGYNAGKLADAIRNTDARTPEALYALALAEGFGCADCLVVQHGPDGVTFNGDGPLGPLYAAKFDDPMFNPRWECGLADRLEIITAS